MPRNTNKNSVVAPPPSRAQDTVVKTEESPPEPAPAPQQIVTQRPTAPKEKERLLSLFKKTHVRFPMTGTTVPPSWRLLERYPVNNPFAYAEISESPLGVRRYFLDEVPLSKSEAGIYSYILDTLEAELTVPRSEVNPRQYFAQQARRIVLKYNIVVPATSWSKIIYFAERDLVGFGVLDGPLKDPNVEDISLDGSAKPVFIYHKGYETLETNITIPDEESLNNIVTRLSHMAGKHVSTAFPIVQGTLPGRHRLIATFRKEVTPLGSSATIRKFREDPLTIIDMLNLNLLDYKIAAYTWLMMQNRSTAIVVGATGAGKTTLLNAILTLTRLNTKLVTIEEVQEINVPHQNWLPMVMRESYAATEEKAGEVGLFELVKAAMRMRPDILVVGEVRGEEAYVLFQAISTGHGGLCTLHSDDEASAVQRLISAPMNVPVAFLPFLDIIFVVRRISVPTASGSFKSMRRIISVDEIVSEKQFEKIFKWDPRTDTFKSVNLERSPRILKLARDGGFEPPQLLEEIQRRALVLKWLQQKGIRNFKEVAPMLDRYVSAPEETYQKAFTEIKAMGAKAPQIEESRK